MVLQQCLACNTLQITGLTRSCACGHVLEDATRSIGGKRYSEYRASLYSRLESQKKRRPRGARENKRRETDQQQTFTEAKDQLPVISGRTDIKPVKRRPAVKRAPNKKNTKKSCALKQHRTPVKSITVPPELLLRFPSALREINRRIIGQNIMWLGLQLE